MITDASDFRPLVPRRLVPSGPGVGMKGPGARFRAGELVEEPDAAAGADRSFQLAARSR